MKIIDAKEVNVSDTVQQNFDTDVGSEELIEIVLGTEEYCVVSEADQDRGFKITYYDAVSKDLKRFYSNVSTGNIRKVISPIFKGKIHIIHRTELESTLGELYKSVEEFEPEIIGL